MTFTQAFTPALNKNGFARCEFVGHEIKRGKKDVVNKETGETVKEDWELCNIIFNVKGLARGTSQKVSISCGFSYSADNLLGKTLEKLGYIPPQLEIIEDEDGFSEIATDEDEEGFSQADDIDLGIEKYLNSIVGNVYIAKLSKATEGKKRGFWVIDVDTLQLLKKAE